MKKENLFGLFDDDGNVMGVAKEVVKNSSTLESGPMIKIGMFTKLILNHQVFHEKLEKFLKKEEPEYDVESTKESSEFVVYNRAWYYLNQVNPVKKEDILSILDFNPKLLNTALENALIYFENSEEYLRCAHIFKIQQILRESKR